MMDLRKVATGIVMISASWVSGGDYGDLPEILQRVLGTGSNYQSISCRVEVELDVPGINMPEKEVELFLRKGEKPVIKGEGITILPRHGIIGQYREFLDTECTAILLSEENDTLEYKIVSLDHRSDWVTVDMSLTRADQKIHRMRISTRKNGEFLVSHFYGADFEFFPERTIIAFEAMPLKLPLKFMGKQEGMEFLTENDGPVDGRIILRYSDISWTEIPGSIPQYPTESDPQ